MKKALVALVLAAAVTPLFADPKPVDVKEPTPGLVGQYFVKVNKFADLASHKESPLLVRVDKAIDFPSVDGQFYGSKLAVNFGVKWAGVLKIETPGAYTFTLTCDDAARLFVGDEKVIDDTQVMKPVSGKVTFPAAGTYPVRLEFHQGQGGAAVILAWTKPGSDKSEPIPAAAFAHEKSAETAVKWDKDVWTRRTFAAPEKFKKGDRAAEMNYGPFLSHTIEAGENNTVLKGLVLKLGDKPNAANVVFDTEMLRYGAGWTNGWLSLHGVAFDGAHGPSPAIEGNVVFSSVVQPGAKEGLVETKSLKDPRPAPFGPLPREWAHYNGLYRNGNKTVLSYSVGSTDVLELPQVAMAGDQPVFTRTIRLSKSDQPLMLLAADATDAHAVSVFAASPLTVRNFEGHQYVIFPARSKATTYKIATYKKDALQLKDVAFHTSLKEDVVAMTKGGPTLWGKPLETKGERGKDAGPYAVDTLTVPEENPYKSWMRFGGFDFFPDGKSAAVCTWSGDVWIVSGIDDSLQHLKWQRYATGLFQALGLKVVDNEVYVLGRDQITHLHDLNHDGEADFYENFNNDCQVSSSFHEFTMDLQRDSKGNFYYVKAGPVRPGGRGWQTITDNNGAVLKVSADGKNFSVYATGLRAPNGMMVSKDDVVTVADNEGTWTPACRIDYDVHQGDFLGVVDLARKNPKPTEPGKLLCWLPHGDVDNSSGGQVWVDSDNWGPFQGQMLALSYGKCSLFKVLKEEVDGTWQGGVVKFPLGFNTGICRGRFNPADGQLYVAGLRGWQTDAAKDAGLQRVRYTGKPVNMPTDLHVKSDGIEIAFTSPLDDSTAKDAQNWDIEQWNYIWSSDYGSPEMSIENPKQKGHDPVDVESVTVSPDHKSVFLKIAGLKPVMQMKIQMKVKAADGSAVNYAIYNTIQKVPGRPAAKTNVAGATEK